MYSFFIALSVLTNHGWYLGPKMPEPIFFLFFYPTRDLEAFDKITRFLERIQI